jgi:hypothetical protein
VEKPLLKLTFNSSDPQIALMHNFFALKQLALRPNSPTQLNAADALVIDNSNNTVNPEVSPAELVRFSSDEETDGEDGGEEADL